MEMQFFDVALLGDYHVDGMVGDVPECETCTC